MFLNIECFISDVYKKKTKKSQIKMLSEVNMQSFIYANFYICCNKQAIFFILLQNC